MAVLGVPPVPSKGCGCSKRVKAAPGSPTSCSGKVTNAPEDPTGCSGWVMAALGGLSQLLWGVPSAALIGPSCSRVSHQLLQGDVAAPGGLSGCSGSGGVTVAPGSHGCSGASRLLWGVSPAPLRGPGCSRGESWLLQSVPLAAPRGPSCSGGSHWLLWGGHGCSGGSQEPLQGVLAALGWECPMAAPGGPSAPALLWGSCSIRVGLGHGSASQ